MTMSTLITVIVLLLGAALLSAGTVLGALLVWTARRVGDVNEVRAELSAVRADHRNLDEIFESYRKRDAQRVSTVVQREKKKKAEEDDAPPPEMSRDDLVRMYDK